MPYQKPLFLLCLQFSGKSYIGNFGEVLEKSDIGTDGFQVSREELKWKALIRQTATLDSATVIVSL